MRSTGSTYRLARLVQRDQGVIGERPASEETSAVWALKALQARRERPVLKAQQETRARKASPETSALEVRQDWLGREARQDRPARSALKVRPVPGVCAASPARRESQGRRVHQDLRVRSAKC